MSARAPRFDHRSYPTIVARHGGEAAALFRTWLPLIGDPARAAVESWASP